ncbi:MAG TPA: BLUF domain-containing protein [Amaricoccus sp.]|jgi:hypothetical protein|nr:BLUF domain-containing protein [Amaricoccus sp.]
MPDTLGSRDLVEFSFVSKVSPDLPTSALLRLARQSWSFNLKMGLTGTLRLVGDTFAEEIEGPCDVVQPLAARILGDPRHGAIRISAFRRLERRRHPGWSTSGFDLGREPAAVAIGQPGFANVCAFRALGTRPDAALPASISGVSA